MGKDGYNCGKHEQRSAPHWDGKHWCNGRAKENRAKEKMSGE